MKLLTKRLLSLLLTLSMLFSLCSGMSLLSVRAATVDYVYSGNYIYNWGVREEVATFLSPMAIQFYEDENVSYEDLAALTGAASVSNVPNSTLYKALHSLMYDNITYRTSYADTRSLYQYTDCENSGKDTKNISSFYSGLSLNPAWDGGSTWNREHVWPNSKSNTDSDSMSVRETDLMMLRPTAVKENSTRSNTPYGESSGYYYPNKESNDQYDVRGDVSRVILYVYTCWGGSSEHDGAYDFFLGKSGVMESIAVMLKWMEEDPVDTWEMGRNDSVQAVTGTRNVFVDYPELAFELFNEEVPDDYESPSGGSAVSYTIKASTNNSAYGTVSVSGKTITATPNTGYAVSSYTILSGEATVTRDGNVFKVSPTSDVSIRINFAKRNTTSVQFSQLGVVAHTTTAYVGDDVTLPAHTGAVPEGYTFVGWVDETVEDTTTKPTVYAVGDTVAVGVNTVLYALYSRLDENAGAGNTFSLYSGALTEGDYLIIYDTDDYRSQAMTAAINPASSTPRLHYTDITYQGDRIDNPDALAIWHIAPNGSDWTLYNQQAGVYAASTGTKNQATIINTLSDNALWTVSGNATYEFVNKVNKNKSINANLRRNGTYGFACYSGSTGGTLTLYKRTGGSVYYFTGSACDHVFTDATCTQPKICTLCQLQVGDAAGHAYDHDCDTICNVCGAVRTTQHTYDNACDAVCNVCGATRVPADHVYANACDGVCDICGATRTPAAHVYTASVTTDATCGADGVLTYMCRVCGDAYTEAIPATNAHTYDNACDSTCNGCDTTRTPAAHIYTHACDTDCNVCGAVRAASAHAYTGDCDTVCDVCGAERTASVGGEQTITFDDTSKRTGFSTTQQVWEENGIVVTNNKTATSSNIANYYNPVRFYKNSEVIIAYPGMVKIVFTCSTAAYATNLQTSIGSAATIDGMNVTVLLDGVDTYTCVMTANQVRVSSITVTARGADHSYDGEFDADCNVCGTIRYTQYEVFCAVRTSVSESKDGVAFSYEVLVKGLTIAGNYVANYTNATITPDSHNTDVHLVLMGAVVSNVSGDNVDLDHLDTVNKTVVDVPAIRFYDRNDVTAFYAVRIINIPESHRDTLLYFRPYYIYEDAGGVQQIRYGTVASASYNGLMPE